MTREIKIAETAQEFEGVAAETIARAALEAIETAGFAAIALAGGNTPAAVYRKLASDSIGKKLDNSRLFFFFGDERNVPPDHGSSNFRMACENLLNPLSIPDANIFRWRTELARPEAVAADYENRIMDFFYRNKSQGSPVESERQIPRFDLVILGLGDDGHTASLFPRSAALRETERLAAANWVEKINDFRFTLTFAAINNAANVIVMATGAPKADTVRAVIEGEFRPDQFPAQLVAPVDGRLQWILDSAAASRLSTI